MKVNEGKKMMRFLPLLSVLVYVIPLFFPFIHFLSIHSGHRFIPANQSYIHSSNDSFLQISHTFTHDFRSFPHFPTSHLFLFFSFLFSSKKTTKQTNTQKTNRSTKNNSSLTQDIPHPFGYQTLCNPNHEASRYYCCLCFRCSRCCYSC